MAVYGVLSDVHGNLQALEAALAFLTRHHPVDELLCLGDIVGYNAAPDACVEELTRRGALSVAGNHDLIAAGVLGSERCSPRAAFALRRTKKKLGAAARGALAALPLRRVVEDDVVLVHGGFDDVCQYVRTPAQVEENDARMRAVLPRARICFFGHVHQQRVYEVRGRTALERPAEGTVVLSGPGTFFVNPGSIDAARRSGERQAELLVFDSTRRAVSFYRVPYDHDVSERAAAEQGYRMTRLTERVYRSLRALDRGRRRAFAGIRGALTSLG